MTRIDAPFLHIEAHEVEHDLDNGDVRLETEHQPGINLGLQPVWFRVPTGLVIDHAHFG